MLNPIFVHIALLLQLLLLALLQDGLSWWSSLVLLCILLFKYATVRAEKTVRMITVNMLAVLLCLLLLSQLWQQDMQDSMLQLLFFSAALRLFSIDSDLRHAKKLVWVQYFLISTGFMLNQSLWFAGAVFLLFFCNLYLHYLLFAPVQRRQFQWSEFRLLLWVMPLCIALFVLFPRLPPLWQTDRQHQAQTGLADELSLGGLERLVQNDSLAFRVEFEKEKPPQQELYWRAKVFERFNGQDWLPALLPASQPLSPQQAGYQYKLVVEPHFQRSLFSLGQVNQFQGQVRPIAAGLIESYQQINRRFSYGLRSDGEAVAQQNNEEAIRNLILRHSNPQASALAVQLKQQHPTASAYAKALYQYFQNNQFSYSLRPPVLNKQAQIDQFLFEHRIGFCGHYASAASYLFRAAGIPARVVGGYQGGSWQGAEDYLQVLQKDAHAWVEYLDQGRWRRFDATAIVAPLRLTQGLSDALSLSERQFLDQFFQQGMLGDWLQQLEWLDYYWSVWVLSFDQTEQRFIWRHLKSLPWVWIGAALLAFLLLALVVYLLLQHKAENQNQALRLLMLKRLKPYGEKVGHQTMEAYLQNLMLSHPHQSKALHQLLLAYQSFEFAEQHEQLQQCRKLLRQLSKNKLGSA
ncbi:transglutaminase family protein [Rheinheimera faecalis]